ncbi:inner membrane ABC transporter permease protein YtfT [mine drainage metagenome]|uniref:Inner membrane ABC transporter permease protein YtfT n=1 Tax=mine drainage metagenome TaxID=410659 RepID=A0A1J5RB93_9ZZZZ
MSTLSVSRRKRILSHPLLWPLVTLALILVINASLNQGFWILKWRDGHLYGSVIDILNRSAPLMLVSLGMTLVIATRGIDISVGAVVAISASVAALMIGGTLVIHDGVASHVSRFPMPLAIGCALLVALFCGLWNGLLVAKIGLQPIIATLILMVAGRGIVHSERVPDDLRTRAWTSHGLQLWVALPRQHEEDPPSFHHAAATDLPATILGAVHVRVLLGRAFGLTSPVPVPSPMAYAHASWREAGPWRITADYAERAVYPVRGTLDIHGTTLEPGQMALLAPGVEVDVRAEAGTEAVLIAGEPLDGPRHIWWNFASSRRERLEQAKADWAAQRFATIPGDAVERIPLP